MTSRTRTVGSGLAGRRASSMALGRRSAFRRRDTSRGQCPWCLQQRLPRILSLMYRCRSDLSTSQIHPQAQPHYRTTSQRSHQISLQPPSGLDYFGSPPSLRATTAMSDTFTAPLRHTEHQRLTLLLSLARTSAVRVEVVDPILATFNSITLKHWALLRLLPWAPGQHLFISKLYQATTIYHVCH